jgi:tetratricopeptide (TPR) repeat protein
MDPGRTEYWHDLGLAYVGASRWRDAASAFERTVQLAPWDARNIADLLQTQEVLAQNGDNSARARVPQLADQVVAADPNHPDAQFSRALAMQFIGNYAEALRSVQRALTLAPNAQVGQWYVTAGQVYVALGRPSEAVDVTRRGLTVVHATASVLAIRIELARDLLANRQAREALQEIDAVLAADPRNAAAQQVRSQIQAALAQ